MTRIYNAHETPEVTGADDGYAKSNVLASVTFDAPVKKTPVRRVPTPWKTVVKTVKSAPPVLWAWLGGATVVLLAVWMVFFFFLNTHPVRVSVTDFSWERKTEIEEYRQLREGDWDHPGDAYNIDTSWRVHHYRQVYQYTRRYECGTTASPRTCSDDVYSSEPVYATWYDYNIDRWVTDHWLVASGTDKSPYWAELPTNLNIAKTLGNEREGNSHPEKYVVHTNKGYNIKVSLAKYMALKPGSQGTANVNRQNDVRSINWDIDK